MMVLVPCRHLSTTYKISYSFIKAENCIVDVCSLAIAELNKWSCHSLMICISLCGQRSNSSYTLFSFATSPLGTGHKYKSLSILNVLKRNMKRNPNHKPPKTPQMGTYSVPPGNTGCEGMLTGLETHFHEFLVMLSQALFACTVKESDGKEWSETSCQSWPFSWHM